MIEEGTAVVQCTYLVKVLQVMGRRRQVPSPCDTNSPPPSAYAGKELRSDNIDLEANFKKYGKRGCLLGWFEVQQAFYCGPAAKHRHFRQQVKHLIAL